MIDMSMCINEYLDSYENFGSKDRGELLTSDYMLRKMIINCEKEILSLMQCNVVRWVQVLETADRRKMEEFADKGVNTVFCFNAHINNLMRELQMFCKRHGLYVDYAIEGRRTGILFFRRNPKYQLTIENGYGEGGICPLYNSVTHAFFEYEYPGYARIPPQSEVHKWEDVA